VRRVVAYGPEECDPGVPAASPVESTVAVGAAA
jgi:hypothetical protein